MSNLVPWWVTPETAQRLRDAGKYGETQNDIICRLFNSLNRPETGQGIKQPVKLVEPVKPKFKSGWQDDPKRPDMEIYISRDGVVIAEDKRGTNKRV